MEWEEPRVSLEGSLPQVRKLNLTQLRGILRSSQSTWGLVVMKQVDAFETYAVTSLAADFAFGWDLDWGANLKYLESPSRGVAWAASQHAGWVLKVSIQEDGS